MLHRLGAAQSEDVQIFEEADPAFFIAVRGARLGRAAMISVHGHDSSETHVVDLGDPVAPPRLIAPRRPGFRYEAMDHGDVFYIRANSGGAADFQIVVAPRAAPEEANWRPFVPHKPGRLIERATLFKDYLVLLAREDNVPHLVVHALADGSAHEIAFEAQTYTLALEPVYEFDSPTFRFSFASMACSLEIYDYDFVHRQRILRKKQETPKDFDASAYVTRCVFARADDGESVPISLMYRRDLKRDGSAPLLVYGYGAYGHAMDAGFSTNRLSLVDRGFVYAIAHVRGGTEKGWRWYEDGKLAAKPNTFADFIAAVRHLVARRLWRCEPRRRSRRQRRRHADGRDRQHRAAAFRRHRRRRAVRRRAQHHARRQPAADAAGMARMGRSRSARPKPSPPSAATAPTTTCARRPIRRSSRSPA